MALLCAAIQMNLQPFGQHASQNENLDYIYPKTSICELRISLLLCAIDIQQNILNQQRFWYLLQLAQTQTCLHIFGEVELTLRL